MSLFNQLGEYGLNQLIARRLTTPGPAPSPTVEPAIFPSLVLESDRPEWGFVKSERLCAVGGSIAAVAAQYSAAAIINPVGSKIIATVERVAILTGAGAPVAGRLTQTAMALGASTPGVRDARWVQPGATAARPTCTTEAGATLVIPPDATLFYLPASTYNNRTTAIIIPPGWTFVLYSQTVNVAVAAYDIEWRERTAQPGEL